MHFHAALTCVRALYGGEAEGDGRANSARWPATRKTTAGCRAATISLGLVIVAASLARGSNSTGVTFLSVCLNKTGIKLKSRQAGSRELGTYAQQMRRTESSQDFLFSFKPEAPAARGNGDIWLLHWG